MIEAYLRPAYQKALVSPIALQIEQKTQCSPQLITLLSCVVGCSFPLLMWAGTPLLACVLLLFSGYLDTLDGTLARLKHTSTPQGAVMDITADRLVEFSVIFGLLLVNPISRAIPALWMLGSVLLCVTTFLAVGIFSKNSGEKSFHYSPGIIERAEAFCFFILMTLLPKYFNPLAWTFTGLVFLTAAIRAWQFHQSIHENNSN